MWLFNLNKIIILFFLVSSNTLFAQQINVVKKVIDGRTVSVVDSVVVLQDTIATEHHPLSKWGVQFGDLDVLFPAYTYDQKKTIRKSNWDKFKNACRYTVEVGKAQLLIDGMRLEVYPDPLDTFRLELGQTLYIKGFNTTIDEYPDVSPGWGDTQFFKIMEGSNFKVENIEFNGRELPLMVEGYPAILKADGFDYNIEIPDTVQVRASFFSDISAGDTLYYLVDSSVVGKLGIVDSVDIIKRQIIFVDTLANVPSVEYFTSESYIFRFYNEDINLDTARLYGVNININAVDEHMCINSEVSTWANYGTITLKNVKILNFIGGLSMSRGFTDVFLEGCTFSGASTGFKRFSQDPNLEFISRIYMNKCIFEGNGTLILGTLLAFNPANEVLGASTYIHTNIPIVAKDCIFRNNNEEGFRQSAAGIQPVLPSMFSKVENCEFYSTGINTSIATDGVFSRSMPTEVISCKFYGGGGLAVGVNSTFRDCLFNGSVQFAGYNDPGSDDTSRYYVKFIDCTFNEKSRIEFGWDFNRANKLDVYIKDCTFFLDTLADFTKMAFNSNKTTYYLKDIDIKVRYGTNFDWASATAGTTYQNLFSQTDSAIIYIDGLRYEKPVTAWFCQAGGDPTQRSKMYVKNSIIRTNRLARSFLPTVSMNLENTSFTSNTDEGLTINSLKRGRTKGTVGSKTYANGYYSTDNVALTKVLSINTEYDEYIIDSDTIKGIFLEYKSIASGTEANRYSIGNDDFMGEITLIANRDFVLLGNADNSLSNLNFTTTTITKGSVVKLKNLAKYCIAASDNTLDTIQIGTGDGTTKVFNSNTSTVRSEPFVPGTVKIQAGAVETTDNFLEEFSGTGVNGYARYQFSGYYFSFDTAPTAATPVYLIFNKYTTPTHLGYWKIVSKE